MAEDLLGNDIGDDLGNLESLFDSSYVSTHLFESCMLRNNDQSLEQMKRAQVNLHLLY